MTDPADPADPADRARDAIQSLRDRKPLSNTSLIEIANACSALVDKRGEDPVMVSMSLFTGAVSSLSTFLSRDEIEQATMAAISVMFEAPPVAMRKEYEAAKQDLCRELGVLPAQMPKLPFERS